MAVLVLPTTFGCQPVARAEGRMRQIYETPDGRIRIVGRAELATGEAETIAGRVQAAYDWVARTQAWPDPAPLSAPLQVTVAETPGMLGVAMNDRFKVGLDYLRSDPVLSQGTLAHELTHIQDRREVRPAGVPGFIAEGRGLTDGFMYRRSLGYRPQPYDRALARAIAGYTPEEVAGVVGDLSPGDKADPVANRRLEFIGAWFVEFLRTRCCGGGFVDVQPRLARVITEMRGGKDFAPAFKDVFGLDYGAAQAAFVAEARQTLGADRLMGTIWQGLVDPAKSAPP